MKKSLLLALPLVALASPSLAHHPLGGMPMETFAHGLLSGVGHPLLGFDHLFFVVAAGIVAIYSRAPMIAIVSYVVALALGCLLMASGVGLPAKEVVIAVSLLAIGGLIASGRVMQLGGLASALAFFGLFHGSAFGDTIATQEVAAGMPVLVGYLIGLVALQALVTYGAGWVVKRVFRASEATAIEARLSGALVAGVGLFLVLESAEGTILSALGLA